MIIDNRRRNMNIGVISEFVILSILPVLSVLILSIPFLILGSESSMTYLIQSAIVLPISFVFLPFYYLKLRLGYKEIVVESSWPNVFELGLYIFGSALVVSRVLIIAEPMAVFFVVIQMLIVAVSEEYWARGWLVGFLKQHTNSALSILIITSLIFTFVTHMNRGLVDNLVYRLPGAIVMGLIYLRTRKIGNSIMFHFLYNVYFSFY